MTACRTTRRISTRDSATCGGFFDLDSRRERLKQFEAQQADPGFWTDQEKAREVVAELKTPAGPGESRRRVRQAPRRRRRHAGAAAGVARPDLEPSWITRSSRWSPPSPIWTSRPCSRVPTTAVTPSSPSIRAPAAPSRRTGPRC